MNRFYMKLASVILATPPALAQTASPVTSNALQSPAYQECSALAASNPVAAEQKALEWLRVDDGVGSNHCRAMALYGQRRFSEAASQLAVVRSKILPGNFSLRSYVTRQTSKAWIDAGQPDAAISAIGTQVDELSSIPGRNAEISHLTAQLLMDRAKLNITYGKLTEAVQDLDHAVSLTPSDEAVLMERASTFAKLGDLALAKQDTASVLRLNPANPKAQELNRLLTNEMAAPATVRGRAL